MDYNYYLIIIWDDGLKQEFGYLTLDEANKAARGYKMAFGRQVEYCCVRERRN